MVVVAALAVVVVPAVAAGEALDVVEAAGEETFGALVEEVSGEYAAVERYEAVVDPVKDPEEDN